MRMAQVRHPCSPSVEQLLMVGTDADGITLGPDEICGCTISVRSNEDIIAVWNKSGAEERVRIKIRWVAFCFLFPLRVALLTFGFVGT